jgi:NAD(P)-dependent dehydrogenase (short-subunit alcohol dehydrogenase family)
MSGNLRVPRSPADGAVNGARIIARRLFGGEHERLARVRSNYRREAPMSFGRDGGLKDETVIPTRKENVMKPHEPDAMLPLTGKKMVVIGGSRGVGRRIAQIGRSNGARVLAVARQRGPLRQLVDEIPGIESLSLDATDEAAPSKVFDVLMPDILVLCAGAFPPVQPLHEQSWQEFSVNWETDVKVAFHFCKAALSRPLPAGASVVLISSGAALAGSPNSGGYAGAKRTQLFIANYSQKESDRLGLDLRFMALAPRIMPDTDLGRHAIAGYSRYLGISAADFIASMASPPTPSDVATAVIELAANADRSRGKAYLVSGSGLEAIA